MIEFLIKWFKDGGWIMYPILVMFLIGIANIVERMYMILFVYHANAASLMQRVQRHILNNNIDEAIKVCNVKKGAAIFEIFRAALLHAEKPFDEIQDHVEVATLAVIPKLQRRMPYLHTIANVATLMGLFGTILGLVETFEAVGAVEGSQKQALLSAGISTALNATGFGLIVAIPCMLSYGYLLNRINTLIDESEHYSARLLMLLRTGSNYFENFSSGGGLSTEQRPKKKIGANDSKEKGSNDAA